MFFNQSFHVLFVIALTFLGFVAASQSPEGMEGNGLGSANEINIPEKPKTAIHRAIATNQRHRGNRAARGSNGDSNASIARQNLSRKIIKKAHRNLRSRAQRQSVNRGSVKIAPEPNAE